MFEGNCERGLQFAYQDQQAVSMDAGGRYEFDSSLTQSDHLFRGKRNGVRTAVPPMTRPWIFESEYRARSLICLEMWSKCFRFHQYFPNKDTDAVQGVGWAGVASTTGLPLASF